VWAADWVECWVPSWGESADIASTKDRSYRAPTVEGARYLLTSLITYVSRLSFETFRERLKLAVTVRAEAAGCLPTQAGRQPARWDTRSFLEHRYDYSYQLLDSRVSGAAF
jgi:hypothetical protein